MTTRKPRKPKTLYEIFTNKTHQQNPFVAACPFCGYSGPVLRQNGVSVLWHVLCEDCKARGPARATETEAEQGWNDLEGLKDGLARKGL